MPWRKTVGPLRAAGLVLAMAGACPAALPGNGAPWPCHVIDDASRGADGVRLADANGDGLEDVATGWEEGGVTRIYLHPGHALAKERWPAVTVGRTPSVEDAVLADLDGDGAADVVSSSEGDTRSVFVHWAPGDARDFADARRWTSNVIPASEGLMRWMFAVPLQLDGVNGPDIVAAGKEQGARIGWFASPRDARRMAEYRWYPVSEAGWIMSILPCDMDGDGKTDILVTDRHGALRGCRWLKNPGDVKRMQAPWESHFIGGRDREVMFGAVADLDGDGLTDVLAAAKERAVLWFRRLDRTGDSWAEEVIPLPESTGTAKAVAAGDLDGDKRSDLVVTFEHAGGERAGVVWLKLDGGAGESHWEVHRISGPEGMKYDRIELPDLDGDGDLDVLTCEEREGGKGLGVVWYENPGAALAGRADAALMPAEEWAAVDRCLRIIRGCQMEDGMIRMRASGNEAWCVPYFGNLAAMALLAAGEVRPNPEDARRAERWLSWYARNQEADGTIFDRKGSVNAVARSEERDSVDSYAATYLMAAWRFRKAAGGRVASDLQNAAVKALEAIQAVAQTDGLTVARPDYRIKYLMDNIEVCGGLREGALFFEAEGRRSEAEGARAMAARIASGLRGFWREDAGCYAWALDMKGRYSPGLSKPYPEALAQLFGLGHMPWACRGGLWQDLRGRFEPSDAAPVERWLIAAARCAQPSEIRDLRQSVRAAASAFDPRNVYVNRPAVAILALVDGNARLPDVPAPAAIPHP